VRNSRCLNGLPGAVEGVKTKGSEPNISKKKVSRVKVGEGRKVIVERKINVRGLVSRWGRLSGVATYRKGWWETHFLLGGGKGIKR